MRYYVRIYFKEDSIRFNAFTQGESKDDALRKVMNYPRFIEGAKGLTISSTYVEEMKKDQNVMNDFEVYHREDGRKMVRHLVYPKFEAEMNGYFLKYMQDIKWTEDEPVKAVDGIKAIQQCDLYLHRFPFTIVK